MVIAWILNICKLMRWLLVVEIGVMRGISGRPWGSPDGHDVKGGETNSKRYKSHNTLALMTEKRSHCRSFVRSSAESHALSDLAPLTNGLARR
jgi:hypothetical protein